MRGISLVVVSLALSSYATAASAGENDRQRGHHEPFLRFVDDLFHFPRETSERDPYEERMETERHDFTQSTKTVGRGVIQIESGYSYFYKDERDEIENSHATPEFAVRWGLSNDIEFRVRWTYAWRFRDEEDDLDSAQDLIWSLKLGMTEACGWIPESALEIRSSVPTGGSAWTLNRVEAGLDYIYGWTLSERWTLTGSTGYLPGGLGDFSLLPDEPANDRFTAVTQSIAVGTELTESITMYTEWYGLFSHGLEDEFSVSYFNIGVDYYLSDNFLLDFRVGAGLTGDSDDFFTGIGGGYRF